MKRFDHQLLDKQQSLTRIDGQPGGRYYMLDGCDDRFYSVTNILSTMIKSKRLEEWKKKLGAKAVEITKKAATRGNELHEWCEKYLLNEELPPEPSLFDPRLQNYHIFQKVKQELDDHVDQVLGIEFPLFSRALGAAGTADVIAFYKGRLAIIDFKTIKSISKVTPERILKYFLQGVFYSIMLKELYELDAKRVVLIFGSELDEHPAAYDIKITKKDIERVEMLARNFKRLLPTSVV